MIKMLVICFIFSFIHESLSYAEEDPLSDGAGLRLNGKAGLKFNSYPSFGFKHSNKLYTETPTTIEDGNKKENDYNQSNIHFFSNPCNKIVTNYDIDSVQFVGQILEITNSLACVPQAIKNLRFTKDGCDKSTSCLNSLSTENNERLHKELAMIMAIDHGKAQFDLNLSDIEKFEVMRRFAKDKYGMEPKCWSKVNYADVDRSKDFRRCDSHLIDKIFENYLETCKENEKSSDTCYSKASNNDEFKSYDDFTSTLKIEENAKNGKTNEYLNYRVNKNFNQLSEKEDKMLNSLSLLVDSPEYKKASKNNKIEYFIKVVGIDKNENLMDPVLSVDLQKYGRSTDTLIEAPNFKGLMQILLSKDLNKDNFKDRFQNYKKERASLYLNNVEDCQSATSLESICRESTALAESRKLQRLEMTKNKLNALSTFDAANEENLKKVNAILNRNLTLGQLNILVNARRCQMHFSKPEINKDGVVTFGAGAHNETFKQTPSLNISNVSELRLYPADASTLQDEARELSALRNGSESTRKADPVVVVAQSSDKKSSEHTLNPSTESNQSQMSQQDYNQQLQQQNNARVSHSFDTPIASSGVGSQENLDTPFGKNGENLGQQVPAVSDKVSELLKRIASAEERVEQMKKQTEDAQVSKKIEEENNIVADLKKQIEELRTQVAAPKTLPIADEISKKNRNAKLDDESDEDSYADRNSPVAREADVKPSSSKSLGADTSTPKSVSRSSQDRSLDNEVSNNDREGGSSRVASSGPILTASNSDGTKTVTLPSGAVVMTFEGMSKDKIEDIINSKIKDLDGKPFLIEEDGLVKEIVQIGLGADGKPLIEKIIRGKLGEKKYSYDKNTLKRTPAAIVDPADLKKSEEENMKRKRAEYAKIKAEAEAALKKK